MNKPTIITCNNGQFAVSVEKDGKTRLLNSKYDPQKEAQTQLKTLEIPTNNSVVVFGFGAGHHTREILGRLAGLGSGGAIHVFEPCKGLLTLIFESGFAADTAGNTASDTARDIVSDIAHDSRVRFYEFNGRDSAVRDLKTIINAQNAHRFTFYVQPSYAQVFPSEYDDFATAVNTVLSPLLTEQNSVRAFGFFWTQNFIKNYTHIRDSAPVSALFGSFKGKTAILVAAGPSLSGSIAELRDAAEQNLIICADTAFRPLKDSGVIPHIIVSVSGSPWAFQKVDGVTYDVPLVFKGHTNAEVVENHSGIKFYATYIDDVVDSFLAEHHIDAGFLDSGGNVGSTMVDLAAKMGARNIIFVGYDFGFTGEQTYASGATMTIGRHVLETTGTETVSVTGEKLRTTLSLNSYRHWLERYIEKTEKNVQKSVQKPTRFINTTEGGAVISGAEFMPLKAAMNEVSSDSVAAETIIQKAHGTPLLQEAEKVLLDKQYKKAYNDVQRVLEYAREQLKASVLRGTFREILRQTSEIAALRYAVLPFMYDFDRGVNPNETDDDTEALSALVQTLDSIYRCF